METEKGSSKGLIVLLVIFALMVLGLGGWIAYDKLMSNSNGENKEQTSNEETKETEKEPEQKVDSDGYEIVNIDLQVKEMAYDKYLVEEIDSRKECENCRIIDFDDVEETLKEKKTDKISFDTSDNCADIIYDNPEAYCEIEKEELKIENDKVVLYITRNIYDEESKEIKRKFIFNTINNPVAVASFGYTSGEDSAPVEFWVADSNDIIYHVESSTLYCDKDCGISIVKIVK